MMSNNLQLTIIQIIIMIFLVITIILLIRQNLAIKYEKRIGKYSIKSLKEENNSTIDRLVLKYNTKVKNLRKSFNKIKTLTKMSDRYEKYIGYINTEDEEKIDYIIHKTFIGICFVGLTIFAQVLQSQVPSLFELLINFIIGFYLLDIFLIYKKKYRNKLIEKEILKAVIIMNNAFKSGKSTLQAVYIASNELPEPINYEFKKIYHEMKYGLTVDAVFERFAKRVNIEEAQYLSSSLIVLNKTGGNIIKVFTSIEKTLFDKKKLKEELKNLTASSNMIVKILLFVPFIFVALIYILNPTYFNPLFTSPLGIIIIFLIVLNFALYVWFLQKIMKVKV